MPEVNKRPCHAQGWLVHNGSFCSPIATSRCHNAVLGQHRLVLSQNPRASLIGEVNAILVIILLQRLVPHQSFGVLYNNAERIYVPQQTSSCEKNQRAPRQCEARRNKGHLWCIPLARLQQSSLGRLTLCCFASSGSIADAMVRTCASRF